MTARRGATRIAAAVAAAATLLGTAAPSDASPDGLSPRTAPRVDAGDFNVWWGVQAVDRDEAFAVGTGFRITAKARRWNGTHWVPTDAPPGRPAEFYAATSIGGEVWASGNHGADGMVARWTGDSWKELPKPPHPPDTGEFLRTIAGTSPTDVWAGGHIETSDFSLMPAMFHWNGSRWVSYDIALPPGDSSGRITGLTAITKDDVWAVGTSGGAPYPGLPFLAHWDGRKWRTVTKVADRGRPHYALYAIDAIGADDIWATGTANQRPTTLHFDGQRWTRVRAKTKSSERFSSDILSGVTAIAADDVWAVGAYGSGDPTHARAFHWNGTRWREVNTPEVGAFRSLQAVSASAPDDVWAVGSIGNEGAYDRHLYLHYDGHHWTRVRP